LIHIRAPERHRQSLVGRRVAREGARLDVAVAHDCRPEADKLASKNSAFPATAAAVAGARPAWLC